MELLMYNPKEYHYNLIVTKCPVCPTRLGKRNPDTIFSAHCEECKATFTWHPGGEKPTVVMDKCKPQQCGCGCGR